MPDLRTEESQVYPKNGNYSAVSNLGNTKIKSSSLLGLRDAAIHAAVWIAASRSPSNDDDLILVFPKLLTAE
jgi:hypothetical protein